MADHLDCVWVCAKVHNLFRSTTPGVCGILHTQTAPSICREPNMPISSATRRLSTLIGLAALLITHDRFLSAQQQSSSLELSQEVKTRCLHVLRTGFNGSDFWPSMHAAEGLTVSGHHAEIRTKLLERLRLENDDQRRCGLARELVRGGDWSKADVMLKILRKENPYAHVHAAESLYKVAEIDDGTILRKAMGQDDLRLKVMEYG